MLLDWLGNITGLMTNPYKIYYGDVIVLSSGKIFGGKFSKLRLMKENFCHQAIFYPRLVYKKYSYSLDYNWFADYVYNLKLFGDAIPFVYAGVVVSIFNDKGVSSQGDADFSRDQIKLMRAAFGDTYVLNGTPSRWKSGWKNKTASVISVVLKRLLPYSYWKYFQSLWRRMQKNNDLSGGISTPTSDEIKDAE